MELPRRMFRIIVITKQKKEEIYEDIRESIQCVLSSSIVSLISTMEREKIDKMTDFSHSYYHTIQKKRKKNKSLFSDSVDADGNAKRDICCAD